MKKAYFKDSKKMFKNNLVRFISIVLIIMLGTAFFIGMNSVSPAMEQVALKYIKEQNISDISLASSLGYKEEDIEKFRQNEHVTEVKGEYTYDALTSFGEKDIVVRFSGINDDSEINKNDISEGRNVENDNECLISSRLNTMYDYEIGDKIKVYRKDDTNLEDYLKYTEFEIVGITRNPIYLSKFYGNTTLLTGELNGYIMIKEEAFNLEEYTTVNIKLDIDEDINKFSILNKNLEKINQDYKILVDQGKMKTFAYSKLVDELNGLSLKLSRLQDDLDFQLRSITSMKDDETRAREQLATIENLLKKAKYRLKDYKIPVIPSSYYIELTEAQDAIREIIKELDRKPIVIKILNIRVDTARDLVFKIYNKTNDMIKIASMSEKIIIYGNRYRSSYEEIDIALTKAEELFKRGKYKESLDLSMKSLSFIDKNVTEKF